MDQKEIHLITPVITKGLRVMDQLTPLTKPGFVLTNSILDKGPTSIMTPDDDAACIPGTVQRAVEAEKSGAKACIVDCFADPGVEEARKVVKIPVYGPGKTSMREAYKLGKYTIVSVVDTVVGMINSNAMAYKLWDNLISVEVIDIPVLDIESNLDKTATAIGEKAVKGAKQGAKSIVLGCTGFLDLDKKVKRVLIEAGYPNVEVFDPIPTTIRVVQDHLTSE